MNYIDKITILIKRNLISFIAVLISIFSIVGSAVYIKYNECEKCEECPREINENIEEEKPVEISKIRVDVKGAVKKPGVYELTDGAIVNDAIIASGGVTSSGVTSNINLSKKLKDEMVVYVFTKKEITASKSENKVVCDVPKCTCEQVVVNKEIEATNVDTNKQTTEETQNTTKISINTDSIEELMKLTGIGEAKAKAIIEYRKANGNFMAIEDIKKVSGISETIYSKIKDYITV